MTAAKKLLFTVIYHGKVTFDKGVHWRRNFTIMLSPNAKLTIGRFCFFNNDCSINANNRIQIGEGTLFGENVKIYDHNHRFKDKMVPIKEQGYSNGEVIIGKHTWIGSNVVLLKGTNIGDNCVIGAGCVINSAIPDGTIIRTENNLIIERIKE